MTHLISCEFNMDTACVELKFADGSMIRNGGGTVICYGNLHHRSFECGLFGNQLSCL